MNAVVFQGIERVATVAKADPRVSATTDVVVEVEVAGLCGSDLHPYRGAERGLDPGTTMGHELVGRIVEVGADVRTHRVGDEVMSPFSTCCGGCARCRRGLTSRCDRGQLFGWVQGGRGLEGAQAERVRVPLADGTLVRRPAGLSAVAALLVGDVVSTGFAAVERIGSPGQEPLLVVGLGAVGLAAVMAARSYGFGPVIAMDTVPARLELAAALGALPLDAAEGAAGVQRLVGDDEVRAIVEAVGSPAAFGAALDIAAPGAVLSVVGCHTESVPLTPAMLYDRNLTVKSGRASVRARMERVAARVAAEGIPVERLVTARVPLSEAAPTYRRFAARDGGLIKAVFDPRA